MRRDLVKLLTAARRGARLRSTSAYGTIEMGKRPHRAAVRARACRNWRAIRGKVLVDVTLRLGHRGTTVYEGDQMTALAPVGSAAAAA